MGSSKYQRRSGIRHRTWCRMSFQETYGLRFVCTRIGSSPFPKSKKPPTCEIVNSLWGVQGRISMHIRLAFPSSNVWAACYEDKGSACTCASVLMSTEEEKFETRWGIALWETLCYITYISGSSGSFTTSLIDWLTDLMTRLMCAGKLQFKAKLISFSTQFASTLGLRNHLQQTIQSMPSLKLSYLGSSFPYGMVPAPY